MLKIGWASLHELATACKTGCPDRLMDRIKADKDLMLRYELKNEWRQIRKNGCLIRYKVWHLEEKTINFNKNTR